MLWLGGLRVTLEGILDWQFFVGKYREYMGSVIMGINQLYRDYDKPLPQGSG